MAFSWSIDVKFSSSLIRKVASRNLADLISTGNAGQVSRLEHFISMISID